MKLKGRACLHQATHCESFFMRRHKCSQDGGNDSHRKTTCIRASPQFTDLLEKKISTKGLTNNQQPLKRTSTYGYQAVEFLETGNSRHLASRSCTWSVQKLELVGTPKAGVFSRLGCTKRMSKACSGQKSMGQKVLYTYRCIYIHVLTAIEG